MDKDDFNFKSEWLYSGLDDQSEERYWASDYESLNDNLKLVLLT